MRSPNYLLLGALFFSILFHAALLFLFQSMKQPNSGWEEYEIAIVPEFEDTGRRAVPHLVQTKLSVPSSIQKSIKVVASRPIPVPRSEEYLKKLSQNSIQPAQFQVPEVSPEHVSLNSAVTPRVELKRGSFKKSVGIKDYLGLVRRCIEEKKVYPEEALRNFQEGTVLARFTIGPAGELLDLDLERGSGFPALDRAACDAIRYASPFPPPPKKEGFPITVSIRIRFGLADSWHN